MRVASKLGGGMRSMSREVEDRWHDCSHGRASHRLAVHDGDKCVKERVGKDGPRLRFKKMPPRHNSNPKECHPCQDGLTYSGTRAE